MSFKMNHKEELNKILAKHGININMRDQIIKKNASIVNESIRILARKKFDDGATIPMYLILLSLDTHFEIKWFCDTILDNENKKVIKDELIDAYGLSEEKSVDALLDKLM